MDLKSIETYLVKEKINNFINSKNKTVLYFDCEQIPLIDIKYKDKIK